MNERVEVDLNNRRRVTRRDSWRALPQAGSGIESHARSGRVGDGDVQPAYRQLWAKLIMIAGHPPGKMSEDSGASWDRGQRELFAELGNPGGARARLHGSDNEKDGAGGAGE